MNIIDINDLHKQIDEIKRRKSLIEELDGLNFSAIDRRRSLINDLTKNSNRNLNNPLERIQNQLQDLQNPTHHLLNRYEEINESSKLLNDLRFADRSINQSFLENLSGFQNSSTQNVRKLIEETFQPVVRNNLINDQIKNRFEQLRESLLKPYLFQNSELLKSFEQITRATTLSSFENLSKTILGKESLTESRNLLKQISNSLLSYDRFTNTTLAKLNFDVDKFTASALKGSLTLANEQMLRSTSIVQSYIENLNISSLDESNLFFDRGFPKDNRYHTQKQELLRRDDIEEDEDYESLIIKSPAAISFDLIVNCLKIVGICNETSQTTKGNLIFTLTNSVWSNSFRLLQIVPTNKENFAEIVDYLYFILIEGAGKDFLRFIDYKDGKHFGYFVNTEPEVEVIWKIKHLRNKWLRHDIEHGKDKDIKKDYRIRKETLEWFGMQKVPQSKDDFIFLYNKLMLEVEEFLNHLMDRVSKFTD